MADDSSTNPGTKISLSPHEIRRENARDKHCEFYNGYHFRPSRQCCRIDQCRSNFVQLLTATSSTAGVCISSKWDGSLKNYIWIEPPKKAASGSSGTRGRSVWLALDGTDVGWLQAITQDDELFVAQMFVDSPFQRRGIGTEVMKRLIGEANEFDLAVRLNVVRINPARRLYERLGFRVTHEDDRKLYMKRDPDLAGLWSK
jgi:GNAT superfamily N-acetyltransferase